MNGTLTRRQLLAAAAAVTFVPQSWASTNIRPMIERKRNAIRKAISEHALPGGGIALIHEGKVAWTEGFGLTDRATAKSVDARTIFSIQSTSKHFTAGHLYIDERKLIVEHEPGLFFSADGEALDFRREPPTWFNIPLLRQ
jgi:hypothetical protein